jgi:nicotinamidase-related amidase
MKPPEEDPFIEKLLAGTPVRVLSGLSNNASEALALLDADAEALAAIALSLEPVAPSADLRSRIEQSLAQKSDAQRREVLVIVDMLNDHLTPGVPLEVPRARAVVPALKQRIDRAHRDSLPVVYLVDHHEPGDPELDAWPAHNTADPRADIWPEIAPADNDIIVTHRSYSGFFETKLHEVLKSLNANTVVLTGCITEIHVFATATDALQRGYRVEVPVECQAGSSLDVETVVLNTLSVMAPTYPLESFFSRE